MPFGFRRGSGGQYEIHPEEAEIVREIFQRVAAGDTYADICRDLNERGIKTRHNTAWNRSSFHTILHNERYIGTYISKYNVQPDAIPAIVDKELFYKVQTTPRTKSGPRRTPNGIFSLTGKLYCGRCGSTMIGTSGTSKSGKLCYYYSCSGHRAHKCDQRSISRGGLESAICRAIWDDVLSDDAIAWMAHQTILDQDKLQPDNDLDIVQAELAQVRAQKTNIMNAIKMGIFTASTRDELLRLEQEEAQLQDRVKQAETALSALPTEDDIISFLELFREGYASQELTNTALLDAFVIRAEIREKDILVYFRIKKEDRQTIADLPEPDEGCSYSSVKWTRGESIRTLYHYGYGLFALKIPA